jgi:cupin fold WbuC family metalloprotein
MAHELIPELHESEKKYHFELAYNSIRKRSPKILHNKGDYSNKVFNFILSESYMHPHLHPDDEKIEKMYLIDGSFALILFDNNGNVEKTIVLEKGNRDFVEVPAYTWHTYVMLSQEVIIYETMDGIYEPSTWKKMASWAPSENSGESLAYLQNLKNKIK